MFRQKTNKWSKEERIKEGKVIKEMEDDLDINWATILNSYHITYNTAKQLIKEYVESEKK